MAIILVILGLVIGLGVGIMAQFIKWNKRKHSDEAVRSAIEEVVGQAGNGTFDITSLSQIKDAYSQDIIRIIAQKLSVTYLQSLNATICDIKNTELTYHDNNLGTDVTNIAAVAFSKDSDHTSDTYCNGTRVNSNIECQGAITTDSSKDIVRYITLPELKQYLNCPGNPLKILNNDLPPAFEKSSYNVSIYAAHGITPYRWCYTGTLPAGLTVNTTTCPNYQTLTQITIQGTPISGSSGSYELRFCVKDSNTPEPYETCKLFVLQVNPESSSTGINCTSYNLSITVNSSPWWGYPISTEVSGACVDSGRTSGTFNLYNLSSSTTITLTRGWWCSIGSAALSGTCETLDNNGDCLVNITCINGTCTSQ